MANKVAALLAICLVLVAALEVRETEAFMDEYASCFNSCHQECSADGNGNTFCEMKCDTDCVAKDTAKRLNWKP